MTEVGAAMSMPTRPTRERKQTQRLEPEKVKSAAKPINFSGGSGTPLGDIPFFRHSTDSLPSDDDILILLHSLFFGSAGKSTMRKRQLRLFAGFSTAEGSEEEDGKALSSVRQKMTNSKKWTMVSLKNALGLFGLEKSGTREEAIARLTEFLLSPHAVKDVPVAKKSLKRKASSKKTKKSKKEKGDKPKRAATPYILFSLAKRQSIKEENPEATFGEISKLLGAKWKSIGEKEKAVWVAAAAAAAASGGDDETGKNKKRKKEVEAEENSVEESSDDDDDDDDDEDEKDDKDLFPDSDDEA